MKSKTNLYYVALIYGIIVTLLMLLVIGTQLIGQFISKGFITAMKEIGVQFIEWNDPSAFFVMYIVGYAIIWWKPLWGSIIIILGSISFIILPSILFFNTIPNLWNLIFTLPTLLVGVLYILHWKIKRKKVQSSNK